MELLFTLKSLGKKQAYLKEAPIHIEITNDITLRQLLERIVTHQVEQFNKKIDSPELVSFLSEKSIRSKTTSGKVGFGDIYNTEKADVTKSIETVIQAYEDGLIAIFVNDQQIEALESIITIQERDTITIIRFTFLTGSFI